MKPHQKAKLWREDHDLSVDELAELTGYSPKSIYWFEKGVTPPMRNHKGGHPHDRRHKPWVWQRYRMACAGVEAQLRTRKPFDWE